MELGLGERGLRSSASRVPMIGNRMGLDTFNRYILEVIPFLMSSPLEYSKGAMGTASK